MASMVTLFLAAWAAHLLPAAGPHPVMPVELTADQRPKLEATTRDAMALSESQLTAVVPEQTPWVTEWCPHCGARLGLSRGPMHWIACGWSPQKPHEFTCKKCGTAFPSAEYPANDRRVLLNTIGERIELPCYLAPDKKQYCLVGVEYTLRGVWCAERIETLAQLYHLTRDERYARRVALLLDRFAEVYPHWLVRETIGSIEEGTGDRPGKTIETAGYISTGGPWQLNGKPITPPDDRDSPEAATRDESRQLPYPWVGIMWGGHLWNENLPMPLVRAYDLIYDSPELDKLSAGRGTDVRRRIEGFFRRAADFVLEFPFRCHVHSNLGNQAGELVWLARVLNEPEYAHFSYRWAREMCQQYVFSREAMFAESMGYMGVFIRSRMPSFSAFAGYCDPPGYTGQKDGLHLDLQNVELPAVAFVSKGEANRLAIRFPNGCIPPIGDNRGAEFAQPTLCGVPLIETTPLERSRSVLLAGYGHAMLGAGQGDRQLQAHLHFQQGGRGTTVTHSHDDTLSLMFWGCGRELLTDVGYHRGRYRDWTGRSLSHNTVLVDRSEPDGEDRKGNVEWFEPDLAGVSAIQVDASGAYGEKTDRFRRTLLLNAADPDAAYLVDVFQVRGGRMHDYVLHGATLYDQTAACSLALQPMPGERPLLEPDEKWVEPKRMNDPLAGNGYGMFREVRTAAARTGFDVTFQITEPWHEPRTAPFEQRFAPQPNWWRFEVDPAHYRERLPVGSKTHVALSRGPGEALEVYLGRSLSLVRSGFFGSDLTPQITRPSLVLRRQGKDPLESVFVAIHEPFYGPPKITAVKRLEVAPPGQAVAIEIQMGPRVDRLLISLDGVQTLSADSGALRMTGRAGLVSRVGTEPPRAWLLGSTQIAAGRFQLANGQGDWQGALQAVHSRWDGAAENAIETDASLPPGEGLPGRWMTVHLGNSPATEAFEIAQVVRREGHAWVQLSDEPGLRIEGDQTREIFFPRRSFTGPCRLVVPTSLAGPMR